MTTREEKIIIVLSSAIGCLIGIILEQLGIR